MKNAEETATVNHLDYLDGWRGLAITLLLIGHFFPVPGINFGSVGVNLFFVLSGYLMGQLLFIKKTPIPVFYRRRISRIVPAHIFFILCIIIFFFVTQKKINWNETLAALFFLNNYFPGELGKAEMPFGHIWSLSVEEHSYVLLSLIAIAARRKWTDAKWLVFSFMIFFIFSGVWYWNLYAGHDLYSRQLHSEVQAYGIFASTFLLIFINRDKISSLPTFIYPCLLGAGILMHWWSVPGTISRIIGVGIFALVINLLFVSPKLVKQVLSLKPLRMMGVWSFSIYLWQQPFYLAVYRNSMSRHLALSLAIACGVTSFYLLERPSRSYLNRVWG